MTTPSISTTKTTCAGWKQQAPNWCALRRRATRGCPMSTVFISAAAIPKRSPPSFPSNRAMIDAVRGFAQSGGPIYAECGGLMYLSDCIRTLDGRAWPMVGLVAGEAVMSERLQALGYVEVETPWRVDSRAGRDADAGSSVPLLDAHAGSGANGARVRGASAMGRTIRGGLSLRQRARLLRACPLGVESQGCRGIRKLLRRLAQATEPVTRPSLSPLHFRL